MYKIHRDLETIPNETILWKYMSLDKYIYLLSEKKLYFNRIDKFDDNKEGTLTVIDKLYFRFNDDQKGYWERERKRHFINCWIESDCELSLMWDKYGKGGVAIKTSVGNLIESLSIDKDHDIYMSRVNYVDEDKDSSQENGSPLCVLRIPMTKRKFYNQEKEVRLLYSNYNKQDQTGICIDVDVNTLILETKVYPKAPPYFIDIVNNQIKANKLNICAFPSEIG